MRITSPFFTNPVSKSGFGGSGSSGNSYSLTSGLPALPLLGALDQTFAGFGGFAGGALGNLTSWGHMPLMQFGTTESPKGKKKKPKVKSALIKGSLAHQVASFYLGEMDGKKSKKK